MASTPAPVPIPALAQNRSMTPCSISTAATQRTHLGLVGDVDGPGHHGAGAADGPHVSGDALGRVTVEVGDDHHPGRLGREPPAQGCADPAAPTGDHHDRITELHGDRP